MFSEGLIVYDDLSVHQKRSCLTPSLYQVWHEPRHPALLEWYHECVRCHQKAPGCSMFHTFRKFDRHAVTRILIFVDFVYEGWWSSQVGLVAQPRPPPILHGWHALLTYPGLHTLLTYPACIPCLHPSLHPPVLPSRYFLPTVFCTCLFLFKPIESWDWDAWNDVLVGSSELLLVLLY